MKKLFIAVIFTVVLLSALTVGAFAKWWDDNPYVDVKSDAWYYDAVRICRDNGIFNGVSENKFGTRRTMTRAMFVTALAGAAGYDKADYAGKVVFDDVPAGKWYSAPVAWACETGVTGGIGGGKFAPDKPITREEFVTMLRKFAALTGYPAEAGETALGSFPDAGDVSKWAKKAMVWAFEKGVISGSKGADGIYLLPKADATREQAAQMMVRLLETKPVREINGNDISLYRIVYNNNVRGAAATSKETAEVLRDYIKNSLGVELPVVSDETEPYQYEILVGRTSREINGGVSVDLSLLGSDQQGLCAVQGDRLIIQGIDSRSKDRVGRTARNCSGTYNGVFFFAENVLGAEVYSDEEFGICKYSPDPVISLPDGWTYIDGPYFKERIFYMSGGILGTGTYEEAIGTIGYGLSTWISGDYENDSEHFFEPTPCLTDEDHIRAVITHVKEQLALNPNASLVDININDDKRYCECENCKAVYRQYGAVSGALVCLINRVCEAVEDEYPDVKIMTEAYTYVTKPPVGLEMHKNTVVRVITIQNCSGHAYDDKSCKKNKDLMDWTLKWAELAGEIRFWDHCGNFNHMMTPFPDWDSMLHNIRLFADAGATGVLMNSVLDPVRNYSDFGSFRAYIYSRLYMDPFMSEEEFNYRMNKGLEAYYGSGWKAIREYLDIIAELGNSRDHEHQANVEGYFVFEEVEEKVDYIDALWRKAFDGKIDEKQLDCLKLAYSSWIYLRQNVVWKSRCLNGTEEERAEYARINRELCDFILERRLVWTETVLGGDDGWLSSYDDYLPPERW